MSSLHFKFVIFFHKNQKQNFKYPWACKAQPIAANAQPYFDTELIASVKKFIS
jgi:hypothetical protein